ncbi:MAG: hypothetical protein HY673_01405 [Chloroflexi bacterium]|nr:hypothetical protein [Chloroflexota bacterium]
MEQEQAKIFNPQGAVEITRKTLSPRLSDLHGKTASLLIVPKSTSADFIDRLEELLLEKYGLSRVIKKWKPSISMASPAELTREMASGSDFVVIGVGS